MKILLVITKAEVGGAQTFILTLARGLKNSGYDVSVAFGEGNYLPKELEKENINYFRLKNLKRNKNPFQTLSFVYELKSLINKEKFDVVHFNSTNTLPGVFSAKLSMSKPKTVFTIHGLSILDLNYKTSFFIKFIFKLYFKFFLNYIDEVVFISKHNLKEIKTQKITNRGVLIYNGLNIKPDYFINKEESRRKIGELINKDLSNNYLIGSLGRLVSAKNYEFLINSWFEIKKVKQNAKLVIIGEGSERKKYEKMIKDLKISDDIFLPGEIDSASQILKSFDLFVLPSIYEGLSISLIEALFAGIPIIASDVGGNREVIGVENCFELNNKVEFLEKLKNDIVINTDKSIFNADNMVKEYVKIYEI